MVYSIWQDMTEVNNNLDKWVNHGRNTLVSSCKHKEGVNYKDYCEKCDISEDSAIPIMNYLYPLELNDFSDSKILEVVKKTNCTILENNDSGKWFLALCGRGMDLSQDIALSYIILETWMPDDLLTSVCSQANFSQGSKNYKRLARQIIKQLKMRAENYRNKAKVWKTELKGIKENERLKKVESEITQQIETHN